MKKITKLSLDRLAKEMPVINEAEQIGFVGGRALVLICMKHVMECLYLMELDTIQVVM